MHQQGEHLSHSQVQYDHYRGGGNCNHHHDPNHCHVCSQNHGHHVEDCHLDALESGQDGHADFHGGSAAEMQADDYTYPRLYHYRDHHDHRENPHATVTLRIEYLGVWHHICSFPDALNNLHNLNLFRGWQDNHLSHCLSRDWQGSRRNICLSRDKMPFLYNFDRFHGEQGSHLFLCPFLDWLDSHLVLFPERVTHIHLHHGLFLVLNRALSRFLCRTNAVVQRVAQFEQQSPQLEADSVEFHFHLLLIEAQHREHCSLLLHEHSSRTW